MIYFTNIVNKSSQYLMVMLEDEDEVPLDIWLFDLKGGLDFKGHMDINLFNTLREEKLLNTRESVFAAALLGPGDKDYVAPSQ